MPDSTLSEAIKEAYASAPDNVVILHTLELLHPAFTTPIRVVRDYADLTAKLEATAPQNPGAYVTFVGYAFDLVLPPMSEQTALPQIMVSIDNVDREIVANIEAAMQTTEIITIIYRPYLSTDLTGPQMIPPLEFQVQSIMADVFKVQATCSFGDPGNRAFPNEDFTLQRFPGLAAT